MTWINGLPSDEQLLANQSRLWLEKEDDAVKKVLSLLPQAERKESGNYRNYVAKECLFEKGYDGIFYYVSINEFFEFEVNDGEVTGLIHLEKMDSEDGLFSHVIYSKQCELNKVGKFYLLEYIKCTVKSEYEATKFLMTLEEKEAFLHQRSYHPIDKEGNKISLEAGLPQPFLHPLPSNYLWFPTNVFHFTHDQLLATFNIHTGEFGICYTISGIEPDFVWKYNKPKKKPTHFAKIDERIIL